MAIMYLIDFEKILIFSGFLDFTDIYKMVVTSKTYVDACSIDIFENKCYSLYQNYYGTRCPKKEDITIQLSLMSFLIDKQLGDINLLTPTQSPLIVIH